MKVSAFSIFTLLLALFLLHFHSRFVFHIILSFYGITLQSVFVNA